MKSISLLGIVGAIVSTIVLSYVFLLGGKQTSKTADEAHFALTIATTTTNSVVSTSNTVGVKASKPAQSSTQLKSITLRKKAPPIKKTLLILPSEHTTSLSPATSSPPSVRQAVAIATTTQATFTKNASSLRSALVNILCTAVAGSSVRSISGSGVFISTSGIILTNAHIGQYFLLKDYPSPGNTHCVIRTGSPAKNAYKATVVFISPTWITKNPKTLLKTSPKGTGEHDIALLAVVKSATKEPLPAQFPYVPLANTTLFLGKPVVIGSYAAQFLSANEVKNLLYPTIVFGTIKNIYTFSSTTVDVISLGGTAAAQEGSSGGGIVTSSGKLAATITTSTIHGATSHRNLYAITASYIRRDYELEENQPIDILLKQTPLDAEKSFKQERKRLTKLLIQDLSGTH